MNYPKITIVTPNFNGGAYLENTIQSVLNQKYPNLEYIIIDGASTDNSVDIIKKYEHHLFYWISEPDNGMYDAIQKGFEKSTGEIMAWINSDDLYHKKSFFVIAELFSIEGVNWLQGNPSIFDEIGRTIAVQKLKRWSKFDFYVGNYKWIQQESVFWRRSLWDLSGGKLKRNMKFAGDLELWIRFFRHEKLFVTNALLGGFRMQSKNQLSLDFEKEYLNEANTVIKEEVEHYISNKERRIVVRLKRINKITSVFRNTFLKNMFEKVFFFVSKKKKESILSYPPEIYFDRIDQRFKLLQNKN